MDKCRRYNGKTRATQATISRALLRLHEKASWRVRPTNWPTSGRPSTICGLPTRRMPAPAMTTPRWFWAPRGVISNARPCRDRGPPGDRFHDEIGEWPGGSPAFADSLRIFLRRTRTQLPQIETLVELSQIREMGNSRGNHDLAADLADRERAFCRVAGPGNLCRDEGSRSIRTQGRRGTPEAAFSGSPAALAARTISLETPGLETSGLETPTLESAASPDQELPQGKIGGLLLSLRPRYRKRTCEPFSWLGMLAVGTSSSTGFRGPE